MTKIIFWILLALFVLFVLNDKFRLDVLEFAKPIIDKIVLQWQSL